MRPPCIRHAATITHRPRPNNKTSGTRTQIFFESAHVQYVVGHRQYAPIRRCARPVRPSTRPARPLAREPSSVYSDRGRVSPRCLGSPPRRRSGASWSPRGPGAFEQWWISTFPGLAILVVVMGFNCLGDGIRDSLDPRLRKGD